MVSDNIQDYKQNKQPPSKPSSNSYEFKASGILIKTRIQNQPYYLMSFEKRRGIWSDLGGKRDSCDKSILETAIREFNEETNQVFFSGKNSSVAPIRPHFNNFYHGSNNTNNNTSNTNNTLEWKTSQMIQEYCIKKIKIYHSKYMLYLLDMPLSRIPWLTNYQKELSSLNTDFILEKIRKITQEYFGEIEKHNGLSRELSFISAKEFSQYRKERKINPRLYSRFLPFNSDNPNPKANTRKNNNKKNFNNNSNSHNNNNHNNHNNNHNNMGMIEVK